jgi:hypothetical protein
MLSIYFVTQTVTTVGYGDVSPTSTVERIFVIILMIVGVLGFSFAAGSLSSIIQSFDTQTAELNERFMSLQRIQRRYKLSDALYKNL